MSKHKGRLELTWTNKDKTLLSTGDGRYDYTFVDPSDRRVAEVRLLREVERVKAETPAERPDDLPSPTTDNLLITGDAMHALDALAKIPEYAEKYLGQVRLVYIDPPFNTGQAFTNYDDNIEHSVWLTMLRDRLRQIKPLLAMDGSVWVHLDDVEVHRCRAIMDEELDDNFIAEIAWRKRTSVANDSKTFTSQHDTILVYGRSSSVVINRVARALTKDDLRYKSVDGDPRPWGTFGNTSAPKNVSRGRQVSACYAIQHPLTGTMIYPPRGGQWAFKAERIRAALDEYADWIQVPPNVDDRCAATGLTPEQVRTDVPDLVLADVDAAKVSTRARIDAGNWPEFFVQPETFGRKVYQAADRTSPPSTWWPESDVGHNREAKAEIQALFPDVNAFATPKPERLLKRIIEIATDPGDIVLDCFAGSGTTAAVAHKLGRSWVTAELLSDSVQTFTKPRLAKIVRGQDPNGITVVTERVAKYDSLPGTTTPSEAQIFNSVLTRTLKEGVELEVDMSRELSSLVRAAQKADASPLTPVEAKTLLTLLTRLGGVGVKDVTGIVKSQLSALTATRNEVTKIWHGGGGFRHVEVAPSMFVEVEGLVLLADWATQSALTEAMCAQLGVRYVPDGVFAGANGRTRVVVIDGMVGPGTIDSIIDQLLDCQNVELWATQATEDAVEHLKTRRPGSRLHQIPSAVLDSYRRKRARRSPFGNTTAAEGAKTDG